MIARKDNPADLFNSALEAFAAGELEVAVASRPRRRLPAGGFF